jgi:hypothetical protein
MLRVAADSFSGGIDFIVAGTPCIARRPTQDNVAISLDLTPAAGAIMGSCEIH